MSRGRGRGRERKKEREQESYLREGVTVSYFALHIYNADEFLEERVVKQNEGGSIKKKKRRSGTEKRKQERKKTKETQVSRVRMVIKIRSEERSSKYI